MVLSKKFYDILSILFVVLSIGLMFYSGKIISSTMGFGGSDAQSGFPSLSDPEIQKDPQKMFMDDSGLTKLKIFNFLIYLVGLSYYILILILAIQMRSKELISTLDVVLIAILIPLAIVFYFLTLRKHFKELPQTKVSQKNIS